MVKMVEGMRTRSICLYLLLIAEAVQALTPDANDLTSTTLLPLLASVTTGAFGLGTERGVPLSPDDTPSLGPELPSRGKDEDQLPDDVCDPARVVARTNRVRVVGDACGLWCVLSTPQWPLIWSSLLRLSPHRVGLVPGNDLTLALCRFLC